METLFNLLKRVVALGYFGVLKLRYWLYKHHFLGSTYFDIPVICVGNLSMGGSGKTPMINYLTQILTAHYKIGIISRGYQRKTSGYLQVQLNSTAQEVGDEPLLLKYKNPTVAVGVGEQRLIAIPNLLSDAPETQLILMDDGYQHLSVKAQLYVLLTHFEKPFWNDNLLPIGTLREPITAKERAHIIIVSNCPQTLTDDLQEELIQQIQSTTQQKVFFSSVEYQTCYGLFYYEESQYNESSDINLITGIANPEPLLNYLEQKSRVVHFEFEDHHTYTEKDLNYIAQHNAIKNWITTEKDAVKLIEFKYWFDEHQINLWVQPIAIQMHESRYGNFNELLNQYLNFYFKDKY